ncbi:MAG: hypothetical protein L0Y44_07455 [Phycisphaerales bacterium]|nr:hypothetical protein [Phycisphaerales bacterium]MCI0630474.1 hypothetical protein [Phycisphaerales bacterium]MCI0674234.1 hypothetical protein [Phycisphaerales bacterium]
MSQTLGIFLEAYREINARKLFWVTLAISGIVVLAFAFIGIHEDGLTIIAWDVSVPFLNSKIIPPATFYKSMFAGMGVKFWLGWLATILALVSTAGIFPEFISSGSIDLALSKPIGRLRLFLTKYASGLVFVALQVTVFSVASFFVLGLKGKTWEPAVFLAIPIVTIFFSYLFSVCVLLGLLTRSTVAALLLTLLVWFGIFGIHTFESAILVFRLTSKQQLALSQRAVERESIIVERFRQRTEPTDPSIIQSAEQRLADRKKELESNQSTIGKLEIAHNIAMGVKTVLPKTAETIGLLERWLIDLAELPEQPEDDRAKAMREFDIDQQQLQEEAILEVRNRSAFWVMGTSLIFEAVVVGLAAWIFCRRDF